MPNMDCMRLPLHILGSVVAFGAICGSFAFSAEATTIPATQQLSVTDKQHAQNAFLFAERNDWREAVLHANKSRSQALQSYMWWRALLSDNSNYDFTQYQRFLSQYPDWPYENRLRIRAETRLFDGDDGRVPDAELATFFAKYPPITGRGKLVLAELKRRQGDVKTATQLVREGFIYGDFDLNQEKNIMQRYQGVLRGVDYYQRADRLVWEEKYTTAGRLLFALDNAQKLTIEARIELALDKPKATQTLARVPASYRNDLGILFERMQWRARKGIQNGVDEILLQTPDKVPFSHKWWRTRHVAVREALSNGRPAYALKLLKNHAQTEPAQLSEALWLQGWINTEFLQKPGVGLPYFAEMEKVVSYPVSKSRAIYWQGRAHEAMGQPQQAAHAYQRAAQHITTFYGQLAAAKLSASATMLLPMPPAPTAEQINAFKKDSRTRVVFMLENARKEELAQSFIAQWVRTAKNPSVALMAAELGNSIGRRDFSVQAAKDALQEGYILPKTGYPYFKLTFQPAVEDALMWAITRQESLFNPHATSSANAVGMMQLLPSTAKEVARKNDVTFQSHRLTDPMLNMRLGSLYLGELVRNFNGSYILAIAAYNAGPGRVRQWVQTFGAPGKDLDEAVDWIERIPYSETRNYVQRIMENLGVYRSAIKGYTPQPLRIREDMTR